MITLHLNQPSAGLYNSSLIEMEKPPIKSSSDIESQSYTSNSNRPVKSVWSTNSIIFSSNTGLRVFFFVLLFDEPLQPFVAIVLTRTYGSLERVVTVSKKLLFHSYLSPFISIGLSWAASWTVITRRSDSSRVAMFNLPRRSLFAMPQTEFRKKDLTKSTIRTSHLWGQMASSLGERAWSTLCRSWPGAYRFVHTGHNYPSRPYVPWTHALPSQHHPWYVRDQHRDNQSRPGTHMPCVTAHRMPCSDRPSYPTYTRNSTRRKWATWERCQSTHDRSILSLPFSLLCVCWWCFYR